MAGSLKKPVFYSVSANDNVYYLKTLPEVENFCHEETLGNKWSYRKY